MYASRAGIQTIPHRNRETDYQSLARLHAQRVGIRLRRIVARLGREHLVANVERLHVFQQRRHQVYARKQRRRARARELIHTYPGVTARHHGDAQAEQQRHDSAHRRATCRVPA
jgi:hypothetical protein